MVSHAFQCPRSVVANLINLLFVCDRSQAFQRFAVRSSRAIEEMAQKGNVLFILTVVFKAELCLIYRALRGGIWIGRAEEELVAHISKHTFCPVKCYTLWESNSSTVN